MMEQMTLWIKDVFLIIISLTFFQIIIPDSVMEKYIRFIFSVIILAVIAEPVVILIKSI
ncbi:MAG: hypothetical protein UIJ88_00165 [Anaerovoracaceae bacterium]|nr:hypothetical protein [Anaerovoracaceae bacterium]